MLIYLCLTSCVNNKNVTDEKAHTLIDVLNSKDSIDVWEKYLEDWLDPETKKYRQGNYIYGPFEIWTEDSIFYFVDNHHDGIKKDFNGEYLGALSYSKLNNDSIQIGNITYLYGLGKASMFIDYKRMDRIWVDTLELLTIKANYQLRRVSSKDILKAFKTKPKYQFNNYSERYNYEKDSL